MKDCLNIGLFGAVINNGNLGCQALTYSIVALLEEISKKDHINFNYYDFEWNADAQKTDEFQKRLGIGNSRVTSLKAGNFHDPLRALKHFPDNIRMQKTVKSCDLVIDLTEGDSFSDIYGNRRFEDGTAIKEIVEKLGTALILGSQTYGPYNKKANELRAAKVMQSAYAVIARDQISADLVRKISGVTPILTCDLAFRLPYVDHSADRSKAGKLHKVGFNVSGLLMSNGSEGVAMGSDKSFKLATDYDRYVDEVLKYLIGCGYEVHLIGHVAADYEVNKELKKRYPEVVLAPEFDNPIDAKSYISGMDLFMGSRMHATIGALTSNTPVIPVAYSRKFTGLFDSVDYPYVVDLQTLDTESAVKQIKDRIENYEDTKETTERSYQNAVQMNEECYKVYEKLILKILDK